MNSSQQQGAWIGRRRGEAFSDLLGVLGEARRRLVTGPRGNAAGVKCAKHARSAQYPQKGDASQPGLLTNFSTPSSISSNAVTIFQKPPTRHLPPSPLICRGDPMRFAMLIQTQPLRASNSHTSNKRPLGRGEPVHPPTHLKKVARRAPTSSPNKFATLCRRQSLLAKQSARLFKTFAKQLLNHEK